MITSHLNIYYFIPTTITTTNQGLNSFKMHDKLASTVGILLKSYQPTDATKLGYKPYKDKWLCLHIFKFTSLSTWLLYF